MAQQPEAMSSRDLERLDSVLSQPDSLYIFKLLDSLMTSMDAESDPSSSGAMVSLRTGYNSNITATGRPFAFGQYGLTAGAGYLHPKGFYADASTYFSRQYSPSFFLSTLTAGYLSAPKNGFSIAAEYSRYFYNLADGAYVAYTSNASATGFFQYKKFNARLEYGLYLGQKTGHRVNPGISMNFKKNKVGPLTSLQFFPTLSVLFGVEQITETILYTRDPRETLARLRQGLPLYYERTSPSTGIMNYSLSAPLNLNLKDWNLLLMYTYNIPKALPGEVLSLTKGGFFSFTLTRYINLR